MAKPLKTFKLTVRGRKWSVHIHSPKNYLKIEAEAGHKETEAFADKANYRVHYQVANLSYITVRHEIVHAFVNEMHVNSASVDGEQMEEIMADWISTSIEEYLDVSRALWRQIEKWINSRAGQLQLSRAKLPPTE